MIKYYIYNMLLFVSLLCIMKIKPTKQEAQYIMKKSQHGLMQIKNLLYLLKQNMHTCKHTSVHGTIRYLVLTDEPQKLIDCSALDKLDVRQTNNHYLWLIAETEHYFCGDSLCRQTYELVTYYSPSYNLQSRPLLCRETKLRGQTDPNLVKTFVLPLLTFNNLLLQGKHVNNKTSSVFVYSNFTLKRT